MVSVRTKELFEEDLTDETRVRRYGDYALDKTLNMLNDARERINRKFSEYGLEPVDFPDFVAVENIEPSYAVLPIGNRLYTLPIGHVEGYYNPDKDLIAINRASIPGTEENERLLNIYTDALRKVDYLIAEFPSIRRPLKKLRRFYATAIYNLRQPRDDFVVHELVHKYQNQEGFLKKVRDTPVIEGITTAVTNEICGRQTTPEYTTYSAYNIRAYRAAREFGKDPIYLMYYVVTGKIPGSKLREAFYKSSLN
jgi:hypothetical protein